MENVTQTMQHDVSDSLRETAMLANISLGMWSAKKKDSNAMEDLKKTTGAQGDCGTVVKNLLASADGQYKTLTSTLTAARNDHYKLTLPWSTKKSNGSGRVRGPRLLPNTLFDQYIKTMAMHQREFAQALDEFIKVYPQVCQQAQVNLAGMGNAADYPSVETVKASFSMEFDFSPIPKGSDFTGLPDLTLQKLGGMIEKKRKASVDNAMAETVVRLRETVAHLYDRMNDPEKTFKAATVENAKELANIIDALNVTGDARIKAIGAELRQLVGGLEAKALRKDEAQRQSVAQGAKGILDRMEAAGL